MCAFVRVSGCIYDSRHANNYVYMQNKVLLCLPEYAAKCTPPKKFSKNSCRGDNAGTLKQRHLNFLKLFVYSDVVHENTCNHHDMFTTDILTN